MPLTSHSCVCVVRTLKIYSLSNFQINNTALLPVASMLHPTLLELIPLKTGFLYL